MFKNITVFFDKLEDKVRVKISHRPILFAFIGGIAIVDFWRGVWQLTDYFTEILGGDPMGFWSNFLSFVISSIILLMTGLYVSLFIGDSVILSGLKREKKFFEKTEQELKEEDVEIDEINERLGRIEALLEEMKRTPKRKTVKVENRAGKPIEIIVENEIKNNETNTSRNA